MNYKALDIAKYVIEYTNDIGQRISHLKLQKLLYYIQIDFLMNGKKAFIDPIIHWNYGPVVKNVYVELRPQGRELLNRTVLGNAFDVNQYSDLNQEYKEQIKNIVKKYKDYTAYDLVEKTHKEDPWRETQYNEIIEIESLRKFYGEF